MKAIMQKDVEYNYGFQYEIFVIYQHFTDYLCMQGGGKRKQDEWKSITGKKCSRRAKVWYNIDSSVSQAKKTC